MTVYKESHLDTSNLKKGELHAFPEGFSVQHESHDVAHEGIYSCHHFQGHSGKDQS